MDFIDVNLHDDVHNYNASHYFVSSWIGDNEFHEEMNEGVIGFDSLQNKFHSIGELDCNIHHLGGSSTKMNCATSSKISGIFQDEETILLHLTLNSSDETAEKKLCLKKVDSEEEGQLFSDPMDNGKTYYLNIDSSHSLYNKDFVDSQHNVDSFQEHNVDSSQEYNVAFSIPGHGQTFNGRFVVDENGKITAHLDHNFYHGEASTLMQSFENMECTGEVIRNDDGEIMGYKISYKVVNNMSVSEECEVTLSYVNGVYKSSDGKYQLQITK